MTLFIRYSNILDSLGFIYLQSVYANPSVDFSCGPVYSSVFSLVSRRESSCSYFSLNAFWTWPPNCRDSSWSTE